MPEDFEELQTADPELLRKWVAHMEQTPTGIVLPRKTARQIAAALHEQQKIIREMKRTARQRQLAFEAATQAKCWFVKDYADGWIFFANEEAAYKEAARNGAVLLVAADPAALASASPSSLTHR